MDDAERDRLSDRVRQVVQTDDEGLNELLEEIRAIAAERTGR
jgi:hypothetical protein